MKTRSLALLALALTTGCATEAGPSEACAVFEATWAETTKSTSGDALDRFRSAHLATIDPTAWEEKSAIFRNHAAHLSREIAQSWQHRVDRGTTLAEATLAAVAPGTPLVGVSRVPTSLDELSKPAEGMVSREFPEWAGQMKTSHDLWFMAISEERQRIDKELQNIRGQVSKVCPGS